MKNRLLVLATVVWLAIGAVIYDPAEGAQMWFFLAALGTQIGAMELDHRRNMRAMRAARTSRPSP